MKPLSFKRFCEQIFDRLQPEVVGRRNEVYLKRWAIIDPGEFMLCAREFNDRRFARHGEGRCQAEWERVAHKPDGKGGQTEFLWSSRKESPRLPQGMVGALQVRSTTRRRSAHRTKRNAPH
jgi:hypothetical protein